MPAIYDLANRGLLPPGFSLVGFARRDWADQDFAQIVHDAVKEHARTPFREEVWKQLSEGFRFVPGDFDDDVAFDAAPPHGRGARPAARHRRQPWRSTSRSRRASSATSSASSRSTGSPTSTARTWRRVVVEKPFGHDLESARELNDVLAEVFPLGLGLPDRPLPRQGDGPEHPGHAVRQQHVRADLELQLRRPRADHDGRGHRHRRPRRLLRRHRRGARRHPEPPAPADGAGRDGGAASPSTPRACASRSRRCSPSVELPAAARHSPPPAASTPPGWAGGEKVVGFLEEEGITKTSTTETFAAITVARRDPPLGRGAVLPAHRQAARPPGHRGRDRLQAGAAPAVHRRPRPRTSARTPW